jgi:non-ribosomal peptide synthetase component F
VENPLISTTSALSPSLPARFSVHQHARLYRIAEYRYFVIDHETELIGASVPAGYAVAGTDAINVRQNGTEAVHGEVGEIVVSSRYLAMGYWNHHEQTAQKFAFKPDGTRLFHTGDLGTISREGVLRHIGRQDWLVKILSNRVELTEIETTLRLHPGVRDSCVVAQT